MEIWKPILNYPGYSVSNFGRVSSTMRGKTRYLKPQCAGKGGNYLTVQLYKDRKSTRCHIAHLVAEAFIGPRPKGLCVLHNNGNSHDNFATNLRYGTYAQNNEDQQRHGTLAKGSSISTAKLNERSVRIIRGLSKCGFSAARLSQIFSVSRPSISNILTGVTWKHTESSTTTTTENG